MNAFFVEQKALKQYISTNLFIERCLLNSPLQNEQCTRLYFSVFQTVLPGIATDWVGLSERYVYFLVSFKKLAVYRGETRYRTKQVESKEETVADQV